MLDIKFIRENVEVVKKTIENKNAKVDINEFLNMDSQRRTLLAQADALKHQKNVASDEIAKLMKEKKNAKDKIQDMKMVSQKIDEIDKKVAEIQQKIDEILTRGVDEVIDKGNLEKKLKSGKLCLKQKQRTSLTSLSSMGYKLNGIS